MASILSYNWQIAKETPIEYEGAGRLLKARFYVPDMDLKEIFKNDKELAKIDPAILDDDALHVYFDYSGEHNTPEVKYIGYSTAIYEDDPGDKLITIADKEKEMFSRAIDENAPSFAKYLQKGEKFERIFLDNKIEQYNASYVLNKKDIPYILPRQGNSIYVRTADYEKVVNIINDLNKVYSRKNEKTNRDKNEHERVNKDKDER